MPRKSLYSLMSWRVGLVYLTMLCVCPLITLIDCTTNMTAQRKEVVCYGGDYRNRLDLLHKLHNCTVIEGHLKILFFDEKWAAEVRKLVFPNLVEITGYFLLHRVHGMTSIQTMFPNLAVIRGRELFFNYALVVYEMFQLEDLGLVNLRTIMRGGVRLEKNSELCYVDSVDWKRIILNKGADDNFFMSNKKADECDVCPTKCADLYSPVQTHGRSCWNSQYCQKICSDRCDQASSCHLDDVEVCCDGQCVGGCYGQGPDKCVACKHVYHNGNCIEGCPRGSYKYHDRRCLSADECRNTTVGYANEWKPFMGECVNECPSGYMEDKNDKTICIPCGGPCPKVCSGIKVDSVSTAQRLKGCTVISSYLEIQITKGSNMVQELEDNLGMIEEVVGWVKITRSPALVSLSFLKNLRLIRGENEPSNNYSLYVVDNRNLQEIWNMTTHPNLTIVNGDIFFDLNRKLCVDKIMALARQIGKPNQTEESVSTRTNGDEGACDVAVIEAQVDAVASQYAILRWKPFKMVYEHYLMGYIIYYRKAPFRNISIYEQRDACGNDIWHIEDFYLTKKDRESESHTHLLAMLEPAEQYVVYIQTYTVALSKKSGRSELFYFRTLPDTPTHPRDLVVENERAGELLVRWKAPSEPKGNVTHYHVYWVPQKLSREKIDKRDYCTDKIQLQKDRYTDKMKVEENPPNKYVNNSCVCKDEKKAQVSENEQRFSIEFQNYLQNYVYQKRPIFRQKNTNRSKNQSMFISDVDLSGRGKNGTAGNRNATKKRRPSVPRTQPRPPVPAEQPNRLDEHPPFEDYMPTNVNKTDDGTKEDDDDGAGDYEYLLAVVYNKLEVILPNLKHFQTYNIEVMACQEYDAVLDKKLCSNRAIISGTTRPVLSADSIDAMTIRTETSDRGEVTIYWAEPSDPNGLIVTYEIQVSREKAETQVPVCIPHKEYRARKDYMLSGLVPGNYSFRIRSTSLAGMGEWTPLRSFQIAQPPRESLTGEHISIIIVVVLVFVVMVCAILTCVIVYVRKQRESNQMPDILYSSVNPEYMSYEYTPDEWEVEREKVELERELGQGSFGMVYEGTFNKDKEWLKVAVKTVNSNSSEVEKRNFLREASVMKAFNCHHVVKLLGVVSKGQPALVLMELMLNGDLKTFLRSRRPDYANAGVKPPTQSQIFQMALEIADGMAYLASKKYVHRDLAARNCMVDDVMTVKIGDFGMTRDIYQKDYYRKGDKGMLPVRWMAPESLRDGVFTSSSDVWSFGVVLWEMATLAAQPYQGYSNEQVLDIVISNKYMDKPPGCQEKTYDLMTWCWQYKETDRPTFGQIIELLLDWKFCDYQKFSYVSFFLSEENQEMLANARNATAAAAAAGVAGGGNGVTRATDDLEVNLGDGGDESPADTDDLCGHISPSHRVSVTSVERCGANDVVVVPNCGDGDGDDDDDEPSSTLEACTEACDSTSRCNKPSAISSSASGDSSKASVKSNGSAFTNGVVNGHAHRPVNC